MADIISAGAIYNSLFAIAPETTFDRSYLSRLDLSLAEGEKTAALRELELRAEFEAAKGPLPLLLPHLHSSQRITGYTRR